MKHINKRYWYEQKEDIEGKIEYLNKNKKEIKNKLNICDEKVLTLIGHLQEKLEKINLKLLK